VVHTAVTYLDEILSRFVYRNGSLQLVAIGCMLIAAKYEEREEHVPTLSEMSEASNGAYSVATIAQMEAGLLQKLEWRLRVASPVHFLGYYARCGVAPGDLMHGKAVAQERLRRHVEKYAGFYADLCLQEASFLEFLPSRIAAASVLTARRSLGVAPVWGAALTALTGYTEEGLAPCAERIFWVYSTTFPQRPEDGTATTAAAGGQENVDPVDADKNGGASMSPATTLQPGTLVPADQQPQVHAHAALVPQHIPKLLG
jgi:hypothetical protein